jgi:VWFA-related protein
MLRSLSVAILITLLAPGLGGSDQQPPTFRAETNYIEVDAFVTDKSGAFVRDLRKEDFELLDDGQPQEIATFSFVDLSVDPRPSRKDVPVETDVVSNVGERRVYVLLLEPVNFTPVRVRQAQNAALRFVDEALGPNDMMAVIHPHGSMSHAQAFTSNKSLLRASIEELTKSVIISGGGGSPCDTIRLRFTYEAIEDVAARLGAISGRRKAILWLGGRVPFNLQEACGDAAKASAVAFMHRDALRAATRNNVAIYPIEPLGVGGATLDEQSALRLIAEDTGGEAVVNTNNFAKGYERIVRDNSTYYLLGYYPTAEHKDGKFHNISVRVKRSGVTVRARRGYYAPDATTKPRAPLAVASELTPEAGRALRSPLPTNGLTMDVFAVPFKGGAKSGSVLLGARLRGADLKLDADDRIEMSHLTIDTNGTVSPGTRQVFTLNLRDETRARVSATGFNYFHRLDLAPGRHEVRLMVHQPKGAVGSVVTHVEVPDFAKEPLTMSGIVLGSEAAAGDRTLLVDKQLEAALMMGPTVRRHFGRTDTVTAFAEVYPEAKMSLEDLRVTGTVTSSGNAKIMSEPGTRTTSEPGRVGYAMRVPLAKLSPGQYIVTLEARAGRRRASRQVLFTVE